MFVINSEDNSIYVTRGDIVLFSVTAEDEGVAYKFLPGDVVRMKVYGRKDAENVVLQKDFPVGEECDAVEIFLSEEDTKIGGVISKPADYWYEVELNPLTNPQTIIGYDEDGAKVFKLFPEGKDVPEIVPEEEEDIPLVDRELDLASPRPVENQAISKAFAQLEADTEELIERTGVMGQQLNNLLEPDVFPVSQSLEYLDFITENTKTKIDGTINSDGVFATVKINLREANLVYSGTAFDVFAIPGECRPIDIGLVHTEFGLDFIINYDKDAGRYYMSFAAQSGVDVAPTEAGTVTFRYALANYEVKDIRLSADGATYGTAGEAVREQVGSLWKGVDGLASLAEKKSHAATLDEVDHFVGYLTSAGAEVVPLDTYMTYSVGGFFEEREVKVDSSSDGNAIFRASISGKSVIAGVVSEADVLDVTDNLHLAVTLPRGKFLNVTVKKQSVDSEAVAFSKIAISYPSYDEFSIPNMKLTDEQAESGEMFTLSYADGVLTVSGNGIDCAFSDATFNNENGLFELQNLSYKGDVIFGAENDYIGPVKLAGGDIIGAKHGGEITDSIAITHDGGALEDGQSVKTKAFTVYVESHIADVISRISVYSFVGRKLTTSSYITALADNSFNRIWCCGILSCSDDIAKAWLSKGLLTDGVSGNAKLLDKFQVVCSKFTLLSNMLWVDSPVGIIGKEFVVYANQNRKKFYNYNVYGTQEVKAGTVFSSCNQLELI